jgi:hypothetical protein
MKVRISGAMLQHVRRDENNDLVITLRLTPVEVEHIVDRAIGDKIENPTLRQVTHAQIVDLIIGNSRRDCLLAACSFEE